MSSPDLHVAPLGAVSDYQTVQCPHCGKERPVEPGVYVCGRCGGWFAVEQGGETDA